MPKKRYIFATVKFLLYVDVLLFWVAGCAATLVAGEKLPATFFQKKRTKALIFSKIAVYLLIKNK
jgi:hypothetical protein